jgi:hypothetical protein
VRVIQSFPGWIACVALSLAPLAACVESPGRAGERYVGTYVFAGVRHAEMNVRLEGARHVVTLAGGADPAAGAASAADCHIRAVGEIEERRFTGRFAEVDTDTFSYGREQAQAEQRVLQIEFGTEEAKVTRADVSGYCGLGAAFTGAYRRVR